MVDEPENLTLKLLREMRAEQAAMREDVTGLRDDMQEVRAEQHALGFTARQGKRRRDGCCTSARITNRKCWRTIPNAWLESIE